MEFDHETMLARLRAALAGRAGLEGVDLDYWADRFEVYQVRRYTRCRFDRYLADPEAHETAARVMKSIVDRYPSATVIHGSHTARTIVRHQFN